LDDERTDPDPKPRSSNFFSKAGKKGGYEEKSANEQQDVAVPFEVARAPDKEEGEQVEQDAKSRPPGLNLCASWVPTGDHDVANAIEEKHQGQ
jgi:hypothetical protein